MANDLSRRWMMIGMCCVHVRAPGAVSRTRAMIIIDKRPPMLWVCCCRGQLSGDTAF